MKTVQVGSSDSGTLRRHLGRTATTAMLTPGHENEGSRPNLLPKEERPPVRQDPAPTFRWSDLIDACIHPAKIVIFEALQWTGQPLSAKELDRMTPAGDFDLVELSYHLRSLAKIGLLERTDDAPTRGAVEGFYFLDLVHVGSPR